MLTSIGVVIVRENESICKFECNDADNFGESCVEFISWISKVFCPIQRIIHAVIYYARHTLKIITDLPGNAFVSTNLMSMTGIPKCC